MLIYSLMLGKLALGLLCLILQINLLGKGNLAPNSATDQVQNYVLGGIIGGVIYNNAISILDFLLAHRVDDARADPEISQDEQRCDQGLRRRQSRRGD